MIAVKGNRVYRIREEEMEARREDGYDIYDDGGGLIAYSRTKTVPYDKYAALEEAYEKMKARRTRAKEG